MNSCDFFSQNVFVSCCCVQYVSLSSCTCFGISVILTLIHAVFVFVFANMAPCGKSQKNLIIYSDFQRALHHDEWFLNRKKLLPSKIRTDTPVRITKSKRPLGRAGGWTEQTETTSLFSCLDAPGTLATASRVHTLPRLSMSPSPPQPASNRAKKTKHFCERDIPDWRLRPAGEARTVNSPEHGVLSLCHCWKSPQLLLCAVF